MKALKILIKKKKEFVNTAFLSGMYENDTDYILELRDYEEAIKELEDLIAKDNQKNCEECYEKADKALTGIESQSSCDGCIHNPKQGENYYDPCGECKRFYGDCYKDGRL